MQSIASAEVFHSGSKDGVALAVADRPGFTAAGTSVYRSARTAIHSLANAAYQFLWAALTGTIIIQVSNKPEPSLLTDTDWTTLPLAVAITQPNGSNTGDIVDLSGVPYRWVRAKYTNTSGTGTLEGWVSGKT